jgi:hypothetical protein
MVYAPFSYSIVAYVSSPIPRVPRPGRRPAPALVQQGGFHVNTLLPVGHFEQVLHPGVAVTTVLTSSRRISTAAIPSTDRRLGSAVQGTSTSTSTSTTTVLHCAALHCRPPSVACSCRLLGTSLHCTALHFTALHCTALHCTKLHCTAPLRSTGPLRGADQPAQQDLRGGVHGPLLPARHPVFVLRCICAILYLCCPGPATLPTRVTTGSPGRSALSATAAAVGVLPPRQVQCAVQCSALQCSAVQCSAVQCSVCYRCDRCAGYTQIRFVKAQIRFARLTPPTPLT